MLCQHCPPGSRWVHSAFAAAKLTSGTSGLLGSQQIVSSAPGEDRAEPQVGVVPSIVGVAVERRADVLVAMSG